MSDVKEIMMTAEHKMQSAIDALDHHFQQLRTGRANAALLDGVKVEAYGNVGPLTQVASVSTPDARTIVVTPWDKSQLGAIEKALIAAQLGIHPQNDGKVVRLSIPPLTEERRKELVKKANHMAEEARVAIRNVRKHQKEAIEKMKKDKKLTEDGAHDATDQLQKLTDKYVAKVDEHAKKKDAEIMQV